MKTLLVFDLTTILGIILYLAFYPIIWQLGKNYGRYCLANEIAYNKFYSEIWNDIHDMHKYPENYDLINSKLIELGKMKFKDKERTNVLIQGFWKEWEGIIKENLR